MITLVPPLRTGECFTGKQRCLGPYHQTALKVHWHNWARSRYLWLLCGPTCSRDWVRNSQGLEQRSYVDACIIGGPIPGARGGNNASGKGDGVYFGEFAITRSTSMVRGTSMSNRPSISPNHKRMTSSQSQTIAPRLPGN